MTTLNTIHGRNRYCGPAALAAVSGRATHDLAGMIRSFTGQRAVKGTPTYAMPKVLRRLGFETKYSRLARPFRGQLSSNAAGPRMQLRTLVRKRFFEPGTYIVLVNNHYVVIEKQADGTVWFADSNIRTPMRFDEDRVQELRYCGYLIVNKVVEGYWRIDSKPSPATIDPITAEELEALRYLLEQETPGSIHHTALSKAIRRLEATGGTR